MFTSRNFPYGTLLINVSGSLIMGLLYVLLGERLALSPEWRAAILIGMLGGYTTFSSFSIETLLLFEQGEQFKAMMNVLLSVSLCLLAVWLGVVAGRRLCCSSLCLWCVFISVKRMRSSIACCAGCLSGC